MILSKFFYSDDIINEEDYIGILPDLPERFNVKIPVDVFDDDEIFLLSCSDISEVIMRRNRRSDAFYKFELRKNQFDETFRTFFVSLNSVYERETGDLRK